MMDDPLPGRCYDSAPHPDKTMFLRAAIALLTILSATRPAAARETWHAVATPPRAGLPIVEVDLGYADGYISTFSSPITLRAKTGSAPFDGYIGFHLVVNGSRTVDVPVISRAIIGPHSQWTFRTWIDVRGASSAGGRLLHREVRIDWSDRNHVAIAEQSIGRPPWSSPRPLRITGGGEATPSDQYLGTTAVVLHVSQLRSEPQWFSGFSSVIVPTATWFQLPVTVREAIFRTPLKVHFIGVPAQMPQMTESDKALLPIELQAASGALSVPWPYGAGTVPLPLTWRAKRAADVVGTGSLPYLVANDAAVFSATEEGLRSPLPSFPRKPQGVAAEPLGWDMTMPQLREIAREHRPFLAFLVVVATGFVAVFAVRRSMRALLLVALPVSLITTLLIVGGGEWVTPKEGRHHHSRMVIAAPGVTDVFTRLQDYGIAPRALDTAHQTMLRGRITRSMTIEPMAEMRSNSTGSGLGAMLGGGWRTTVRYAEHRERSTPAEVRIASRSAQELVVDFEAAIPIDYVAAQWTLKGKKYVGQARAGSRSRGRVTVRHRERVGMPNWDWLAEAAPTGATRVTLMQVGRDRTTVIRHSEHLEDVEPAPPYEITAALHRDLNGISSATMLLPTAIPPGAKARIVITQTARKDFAHLKMFDVAGPAGVASVDVAGIVMMKGKDIDADPLRRVAPAGGVIRWSIHPSVADLSRSAITLQIVEEKQ